MITNPPLFILVYVPENSRWTHYYMNQWASLLDEKGIMVSINFLRYEMITPMVRCRFIPDDVPEWKLSGLRADEVFGVKEQSGLFRYRKGGIKGRFTGTFMEFLELMNQARIVKKEETDGTL